MLHVWRNWHVGAEIDPLTLADKLTQQTWTVCTGFRCRGYLWLNDATCEDGAQEYAVVVDGEDYRQVESVTASWCTAERLREIEARIVAGGHEGFGYRLDPARNLLPVGLTCARCL